MFTLTTNSEYFRGQWEIRNPLVWGFFARTTFKKGNKGEMGDTCRIKTITNKNHHIRNRNVLIRSSLFPPLP